MFGRQIKPPQYFGVFLYSTKKGHSIVLLGQRIRKGHLNISRKRREILRDDPGKLKRWIKLKDYELVGTYKDETLLEELLTSDIDFLRKLGLDAHKENTSARRR